MEQVHERNLRYPAAMYRLLCLCSLDLKPAKEGEICFLKTEARETDGWSNFTLLRARKLEENHPTVFLTQFPRRSFKCNIGPIGQSIPYTIMKVRANFPVSDCSCFCNRIHAKHDYT